MLRGVLSRYRSSGLGGVRRWAPPAAYHVITRDVLTAHRNSGPETKVTCSCVQSSCQLTCDLIKKCYISKVVTYCAHHSMHLTVATDTTAVPNTPHRLRKLLSIGNWTIIFSYFKRPIIILVAPSRKLFEMLAVGCVIHVFTKKTINHSIKYSANLLLPLRIRDLRWLIISLPTKCFMGQFYFNLWVEKQNLFYSLLI